MEFLTNGPDDSVATVALAHGAGAGMDTPFMSAVAEGLARHRLRVVRFEFPYMQKRRANGERRAPDSPRVLEATWKEVIAVLGHERLVIGGKSMGGRVRLDGGRRRPCARARLPRLPFPSTGQTRKDAYRSSAAPKDAGVDSARDARPVRHAGGRRDVSALQKDSRSLDRGWGSLLQATGSVRSYRRSEFRGVDMPSASDVAKPVSCRRWARRVMLTITHG